MKSLIRIFALLIAWNSVAWITPQEAVAQRGSVSFQIFYDELSPYGMWVDYPNYGYVWIPDVDREFSPYGTDGHWVFTDDGWAWVSDYSWGWAPFHYGRWAYDDSYGWFWVPHHEWGPAWVTWRRSAGYYGWAPMQPGMSIEVSFGRQYRVPYERWIFVRDRYFSRRDIGRYYVNRTRNVTIINNSTVINNTYIDNGRHTTYVTGPAREDVQKVTGTTIRPVAVREYNKPGQVLNNDQLQIYRPQVQTSDNKDRGVVPSKLVNLKEVKPVSERKLGVQRRNDNLPDKETEQSSQPQNANLPDRKSAADQPRVVNPPEKHKSVEQPSQPQIARPPDKKGREQPGRTLDLPKKGQPQQPRKVNPPKSRDTEQQPQSVTPPRENSEKQPSPPKRNQEKKEKGKPD